MNAGVSGIHHVTAIAGDPQKNLNFYHDVLGLRMVKRTVNFDDPTTYHFYFGDNHGSPGSILTFFPWGDIPKAGNNRRVKSGQATSVALSIPIDQIDYWLTRLQNYEVNNVSQFVRFNEPGIAFDDPDGLAVELIGVNNNSSSIEIDRIHNVTLTERSLQNTEHMLILLGYSKINEEGNRFRYKANVSDKDKVSGYIDVLVDSSAGLSNISVGSIHHIALRAPDLQTQEEWRNKLVGNRIAVSPIRERVYFQSIYFHEPGGTLFEIATDGPGFMIDEDVNGLGNTLKLPPWLEQDRSYIEQTLPMISYLETKKDKGDK